MSDDPLRVTDDAGCFGCGAGNAAGLGLVFRVDAARRTAECETCIDDRFQGWRGIVHGGIIATLLDEAAVHATRSLADEALTAALNITYRSPVATGTHLRLEAEVVDIRRRLVLVQSRLLASDGRLLAEAEAKIVLATQQTPP